jgi:uncharacterized protein (TIGR02466 family)
MIKEIFPIKIYTAQFPDYELIQADLEAEIRSYFDVDREAFGKHRLFNGSYSLEGTLPHEIRDLHKRIKHQEVIQFIEHHINEYWKELGFHSGLAPTIEHMWANLTPKGGNIIHHNHNPFEIAGSFYVNATPDMGCIALVDPLEVIRGRLPIYDSAESKQGRYFFDHVEPPAPGKLVLFPGWLYHKTQPNPSDKERIVMGMNVRNSLRG